MEWQPIDTAPNDGTHVLVYDGWPISAWWDDEERGYGGQCWRSSSTHEWLTPTHWMPLPNPPALGEGK